MNFYFQYHLIFFLNESAAAFYCIFISFILYFSSGIFTWFILWFLFKDTSLFVLLPWLCWIIFLCFLVAHWVSLKQLFWIIYVANWRSPCLWIQLWSCYLASQTQAFFFFLNALATKFYFRNSKYTPSIFPV